NDPMFGSLDAKQFRFDESDDPSNIQIYKSLTCRRDRREGDPENAAVSSTVAVNTEVQTADRQGQEEVRQNNSSRRESPVLQPNSPYLHNPNSDITGTQR